MSRHNDVASQATRVFSEETDLVDFWHAVVRYKKLLIATIAFLSFVGWAYSLILVENRYSIESIVSLGADVRSEGDSKFMVLKIKEFLLPDLIESSDPSLAKLLKKVAVSQKKGTRFIFLKSSFLKPDSAQQKIIHNMITTALMDLLTSDLLISSPDLHVARAELAVKSQPDYLLKHTLGLYEQRTITQKLLEQLKDESEQTRNRQRKKDDIKILTEAYNAYVKAKDALTKELVSLPDSSDKAMHRIEMLVSKAATLRDMAGLALRKNRVERELQDLDGEISQRIDDHVNKIDQLDKWIEFRENSHQQDLALLRIKVSMLEQVEGISGPHVMVRGRISPRPIGLSKTKTLVLTIPAAIMGGLILVLVVSIFSRVKRKQEAIAE